MTSDFQTILEMVNSAGLVGLLVFLIAAFQRGELISKTMLERILNVYEERLEVLTEEIVRKLDEIMRSTGDGGAR